MRTLHIVFLALFVSASPTASAENIRGTVRDDAGKPVAGVMVEAVDPQHPPAYHGGPAWMRATTDADGRYLISNAHPSELYLRASGDDVLPSKPAQVRVLPQQELTADFVVPRAVSISGNVLDEQGQPIAEAFVSCEEEFGLREPKQDNRARQGSAYTEKDGSFLIRGLPPGQVHLRAQVKDRPEQELIARAPGTGATFHVASGLGVSGIVIDATGAPIARAEVSFRTQHPADRREVIVGQGFARADAQGHFSVAGLKPGTYWLVAEDAQRRAWFSTVSVPAQAELRSVQPALQSIRGKVENHANFETQSLKVSAYQKLDDVPEGATPPLFGNSGNAPVAADGSFELAGLMPGAYTLFASGYAGGKHVESTGVVVNVGSNGVALVVK